MALSDNQTNSSIDQQAQAEFAAAFEEAAGPDEAEDRGALAAAEASTENGGAADGAAEAGEGLNLDAAVAESQADGGAEKPAAEAAAAEGETQTDGKVADADPAQAQEAANPEDEAAAKAQRLKSWEGRLKAMARQHGLPEDPDDPVYAEKAPADAAEALEKVADDAKAIGNDDMAQAAQDVAEKVESAQITPEEARKILAEDFGESFLDLLMAAVGGQAGNAQADQMEALRQSTSDEISQLKNAAQRNHYRTIERAHKDFQEITESPEFKEFVAQDPARAVVVESGDAFDAIDLLDAFKASQKTMESNEAASSTTDEADDADVAVRATGGLRLPAEPAKDTSFEDAWHES